MNLTEQLQSDMKAAMRSGATLQRDTLRMAIAAAQNAAKDKRAPLSDEEALDVIAREVKKRRESVQAYTDAGRTDLAAAEQSEIDILTPYLPPVTDALSRHHRDRIRRRGPCLLDRALLAQADSGDPHGKAARSVARATVSVKRRTRRSSRPTAGRLAPK